MGLADLRSRLGSCVRHLEGVSRSSQFGPAVRANDIPDTVACPVVVAPVFPQGSVAASLAEAVVLHPELPADGTGNVVFAEICFGLQ